MTAVGPYSEATLLFEPEEPQGKAIDVATPGTVLDYIARNHPSFLNLIRKANLLPFYNDTGARDRFSFPKNGALTRSTEQPSMTVFVPREDTKQVFPMLDGNTAWRICKMSTVPGMVTTTMLMSSPALILYSLGRQPLNVSSNQDKEIWVSACGDSVTYPCSPDAGKKSLLFGDIVCSNGIVHVIDGLLWPTW